jgi:hypothetical protein
MRNVTTVNRSNPSNHVQKYCPTNTFATLHSLPSLPLTFIQRRILQLKQLRESLNKLQVNK